MCRFFCTEFDLLGHHLSVLFSGTKIRFTGLHRDVLRGLPKPDTRTSDALRGLPMSDTRISLRKCIGLFNRFREYVPHYPTATNLLQNRLASLLKLYANWLKISEAERQQFQALIDHLTSDEVVFAFDSYPPLFLQTDARASGLGTIISQKDSAGKVRVIGYYSHRNSPTESRFKSCDLELLAIIKAATHYCYMLLGRHFTILTDHSALVNLRNRHPTILEYYNWDLSVEALHTSTSRLFIPLR